MCKEIGQKVVSLWNWAMRFERKGEEVNEYSH